MQEFIQLIFGIFLIGIIPVLLTLILRKSNTFFKKVEYNSHLIYNITLTNIVIIFLIYKNTDILLGTFIGSSLFQLLAVGGVNQLTFPEKGKMQGKGQYLVFSMIVLLFLSADYLLTGKAANNILNRIDGGVLFFLFLVYLYFVYGRGKTGFRHKQWKAEIMYFLILEIVILLGSYLLVLSIPKIGTTLRISQYLSGLTLVSWCTNLSTILLSRKNVKEQSKNYLERAMEGTVFSMTFLLGIVVLVQPLAISHFMIYDLILFGVISLLLQWVQKIDNRLAGSSMATVYIAFMVYTFLR